MSSKIYITGLTRGNGLIGADEREGTLVGIYDFEKWSLPGDRKDSEIALKVSNSNGDVLVALDNDLPPGTKIRVHIRHLGFDYIGFNGTINSQGDFHYTAKLIRDRGISVDFVKNKYPNCDIDAWDTEFEFTRATARLIHFATVGSEAPDSESDPAPAPTCFLSYSWESDSHNEWVVKLANTLVQNGVNVTADFYDSGPGKDVVAFMDKMSEQDRVVLVLTPTFKEKAAAGQGGVGYEHRLVTNELITNGRCDRFVPVLRSGDKQASVPDCFGTIVYVDMTDDAIFEESLDILLRALFGVPRVEKPAIGIKPNFSR